VLEAFLLEKMLRENQAEGKKFFQEYVIHPAAKAKWKKWKKYWNTEIDELENGYVFQSRRCFLAAWVLASLITVC